MTKAKRLEILAFKAKHDWSYQLIADNFGVTRNQVAGIIFRDRYPCKVRISSPKGNRNKIGTGRHGPGKMPRYSAQNFEVRNDRAA